MPLDEVKALTFDVFGTVVDWRGSILAEGERLNHTKGLTIDWGRLADAWRGRYQPSMERVMRGELPWTPLDALHRASLDQVLAEQGEPDLSDAERDDLNLIWHRLRPWPDSVPGLTRLRERYILATLSNGNLRLLVDMARHAGLPWDCILSAELARAYKPHPRAYQTAVHLLALLPGEVMMVAAHPSDLRAARAQGMRTAFISRPLEHGPAPNATPERPDPGEFDLYAADLLDLADKLGG